MDNEKTENKDKLLTQINFKLIQKCQKYNDIMLKFNIYIFLLY